MYYKADDDGRLSPAKKDNTIVRKIDHKGWTVFNLVDYRNQFKSACSIGIIGTPDNADLKHLESMLNMPVRLISKKGKHKLVIGKGLFKKSLKLNSNNNEVQNED